MSIRSSIVVIFLPLLLPSLSYGIACSEYFESAGKPAFMPRFAELTPEQAKDLVLNEPALSFKPKVQRLKDGKLLLSFPGAPKGQLEVYGVQATVKSIRPNFKEIEGFRRYAESSEVVKNVDETLFHSQVNRKFIAFGPQGGNPMVFGLSAHELPSALLELDPTLRVLATLEANEPLGFGIAREKTYLVRLYYLQAGAYSMTSFRMPYTEEFPAVKFFMSKGGETILKAGEKQYSFSLAKFPY